MRYPRSGPYFTLTRTVFAAANVRPEADHGGLAYLPPIADWSHRPPNDTRYGRSAAILARDITRVIQFSERVHGGIVYITVLTVHLLPV